MKKIFLLFSFILQFSISSINYTQDWTAYFGGPDNEQDMPSDIAIDGNGNVYVTGYINSNTTDDDYATVKYNSSGVQQWARYYNNNSRNDEDIAFGIAVDQAGNSYVTGYSTGGAPNYDDIVTIKYDPDGNVLWTRNYTYTYYDEKAYDVAIDAAGNCYVTGYCSTFFLTVKYSSSGTELWSTRYHVGSESGYCGFKVCVSSTTGNVYATGYAKKSIVSGTEDILTIKYNSSGAIQWTKLYNGAKDETDIGKSVAVDGSGNVYVTGYGGITSAYYGDYITIRYSDFGSQLWVKTHNGPGNENDIALSSVLDNSGNVYVTGRSYVSSANYTDFCTIKYDPYGNEVWKKYFDNGAWDEAEVINIDGAGNLYVTGTSWDYYDDIAVVKYNPAGEQQWMTLYHGYGDSYPDAAVVDQSGKVYVTGHTDCYSDCDYVTFMWFNTIGIKKISGEIPREYMLSQNYPNPFNPSTNISFAIPKAGNVILKVYDIMGRETKTIINEYLKAGTYTVDFDASELPSGIYLYAISTGDFTETRKMMLIK
jgi:hypothetical protein